MIFGDYAKYDEESEEKVINPIGFKKLCRDYKIYSVESQNRFLDKQKEIGFIRSKEELASKWREIVNPKFEIL